jgi:hypothetical protein
MNDTFRGDIFKILILVKLTVDNWRSYVDLLLPMDEHDFARREPKGSVWSARRWATDGGPDSYRLAALYGPELSSMQELELHVRAGQEGEAFARYTTALACAKSAQQLCQDLGLVEVEPRWEELAPGTPLDDLVREIKDTPRRHPIEQIGMVLSRRAWSEQWSPGFPQDCEGQEDPV